MFTDEQKEQYKKGYFDGLLDKSKGYIQFTNVDSHDVWYLTGYNHGYNQKPYDIELI